MPLNVFDIAVIGAGVVGCAMARRFTLDGAGVVVLEKASDVLDGASKGNSAILHTGFDAPPGSLEQACIAKGYAEYHDIAARMGLPILKSGALVLAWNDGQAAKLPRLIEKAHKNGVTDVAMLSRSEILHQEPHLSERVVSGFKVPGEQLIDPWTSAHAYLLQAVLNGAKLQRATEVLAGSFDGNIWRLQTNQGEIAARQVINCAGLYGDVVEERLCGQHRFTITPRKGQFIVFDKAASDLVSAIILPVPTDITKGVVLCRTIFGNLLVGPTAEDQESRTKATTDREMLMQLHRQGMEMLPALKEQEITATYAGLRPASEYQDYQILHQQDKNYVTVGGIRSTGLSAALGIARHVAKMVHEVSAAGLPIANPVMPKVDRLSNYHPRDWQEPDGNDIICHCERVTCREIKAVLNSPIPPATLQGLKRRTRVTMGRCQGFYCTAALATLTEGCLKQSIGKKHADK